MKKFEVCCPFAGGHSCTSCAQLHFRSSPIPCSVYHGRPVLRIVFHPQQVTTMSSSSSRKRRASSDSAAASGATAQPIPLHNVDGLDAAEKAFGAASKKRAGASGTNYTAAQRALLTAALGAVKSFVFGELRARCSGVEPG